MKRIYRSSKEKVFAGVCGGLGEYFDKDPVFFRIMFVVITLLWGFGLMVYLIMWLCIPNDTKRTSAS